MVYYKILSHHKNQKKIFMNGNKVQKEAEEIISRLTFPDTGDVVLDLMMGTGTNIKATLDCVS
jgi:hypothetical protein